MSEATKRPGRPRLDDALVPVTLSLPPALVARLVAAQARLASSLGWTRPTRSAVGRLVVERGLAALESEAPMTAPGSAA